MTSQTDTPTTTKKPSIGLLSSNSTIPVVQDEIQKEVNRIWLETPGVGVNYLMKKLQLSDNLQLVVTKQRVKAAKQAIPFIYIPPPSPSPPSSSNTTTLPATLTEDQIKFVERKIQERNSVRNIRRYKESDEIMKGLTAMGIILDDTLRTWTVGEDKKLLDDDEKNNNEMVNKETSSKSQNENDNGSNNTNVGVPCSYCNQYFASKNLVFRHLRDVSTSCGNAIFASGQKLPDAPSDIQKSKRQKATRETMQRRRKLKSQQHKHIMDTVDEDSMLWFGDLPIAYTRLGGQNRRLRAVLRAYLPRDVPSQPWIKKVVRKAYRRQKGNNFRKMNSNDDHDDHDDHDESIQKELEMSGTTNEEKTEDSNEYVGYAIIVFRDAQEAEHVKATMDGLHIESQTVFSESNCLEKDSTNIPSFVLKVNHMEKKKKKKNTANSKDEKRFTCGNQDPPLRDQLFPLSIPILQERCNYLRNVLSLSEEDKDIVADMSAVSLNNATDSGSAEHTSKEHMKVLERTIELYEAVKEPRKEVHRQGRLIPQSIRENLLHLLTNTRWPAASHRKGLTSERYLVLQTNVTNDRFYGDLREGCRELMQWADPTYFYSGIAVTKNFVSSPHIDDRDQTYQYAVSLGNFENGGQLCVEAGGWVEQQQEEPKPHRDIKYNHTIHVVDTQNKIAKIDGRSVHWVRSWEGGDRYSIIFYDTCEREK